MKKITNLNELQIRDILEYSPELTSLAVEIYPEIEILFQDPKYQRLKAISTKEEFEENFDLILSFLQKIGIVGKDFEEKEQMNHENYKIGPEGLMIVNAFYRCKDKYRRSSQNSIYKADSPVQVVSDRIDSKQLKIPRYGSYYKDYIHQKFLDNLLQDLPDSRENVEFDRIYVVVEGEVGSNHAFCVAIRKMASCEQPIVEFFDSSPGLVRSGIAFLETMNFMGKTAPSLLTIATVGRAFEKKGYVLNKDNFFQNSEPFQRYGFSYCATFAMERAYEIASMNREQHLDELKRIYRYDSILGGKTEIDLSVDEVLQSERDKRSGKEVVRLGADKEKVIESQTVAMGQFFSHYSDSRRQSERKKHLRKSGELEKLDQRRSRYVEIRESQRTGEEIEFSTLSLEKSMRHRIHIFEIIRSDAFRDFVLKARSSGKELPNLGMSKYIEDRRKAVRSDYPKKLDERKLFEDKYGFCKNFEYDHEKDSVKIMMRCGSFIRSEIERDFQDIGDIKLMVEDSEPENPTFKQVGVIEGLTKRFFLDIEINNAKAFFSKLKIESEKKHKAVLVRKAEKLQGQSLTSSPDV